MSLRARMGLAAGVAVAIAVLAVAVTAYEGTRSELKGQVDSSLQSLTCSLLSRPGLTADCRPVSPGAPGPGRRPVAGQTSASSVHTSATSSSADGSSLGFVGTQSQQNLQALKSQQAQQQRDPDDRDEGLGLDDRNGPAFGGAPGTLTLVKRDGGTYKPRGQKYSVPLTLGPTHWPPVAGASTSPTWRSTAMSCVSWPPESAGAERCWSLCRWPTSTTRWPARPCSCS